MEAAVTCKQESRSHSGTGQAPFTLLEYGDYECPFCGQAYVIIKQLQEALGDNLRSVFRNFPKLLVKTLPMLFRQYPL